MITSDFPAKKGIFIKINMQKAVILKLAIKKRHARHKADYPLPKTKSW